MIKLEISNILSIEHAEVIFPDTGLVLVDGWNYDKDGANGAGKTAIFNALSYCLYGDVPRSITKSEIPRRGAKSSYVKCTLSTKYGVLEVLRKKANTVSLRLNGNDIDDTNIIKYIGVSYDQFTLVQYFAQDQTPRFLDLNDTGRKDLLVKLISAELIEKAKAKSDAELKTVLAKIAELQASQQALQSKKTAYLESIVDVSALNEEVDELAAQRHVILTKIQQLDKVEQPDLNAQYSVLKRIRDELDALLEHKGTIAALKRQLRDLENEYSSNCLSCPSCSATLMVTDDELVAYDVKASQLAQEQKKANLISSVKALEAKLVKEAALRDASEKCQNHINQLSVDYKSAKARRSELQAFLGKIDANIAGLKSQISRNDLLVKKVSEIETAIASQSANIATLDIKLLELQAASQALSPTGVPAYIMDNIIDLFNDKVQNLISSIWPDASYSLLSYRESKSGNVTAKMSDSLHISGVKCSVGSLSGGERRCLSLAIDLALLDVVSTYTGTNINPVILDEPFNNLDHVNREVALEVIREASRTRCIVVVDHASEVKASFDTVWKVVKRGGISTLLVE